MHTCIPLSERGRWTATLGDIPHAFAHTWGSCHAMQLTSGLDTFLYCYEDEHARIVCPLSVRAYDGYPDVLTPYGFSGFTGIGYSPDFPARWVEFARKQGFVCGYVALNPTLDGGWVRQEESHRSNHAFLMDLTATEADMHARLSTNRRRQLRAWGHEDVELVFDRSMLARFFAEHLAAFLDERDAARVYYLSSATMEPLFALDDVFLVGAAVDGRLEAVSVFAHTPYVGDFLFNVSVPSGRRHSAGLIWQGAMHLKALAVPVLNLGGGIRPGDGVALFKKRFGAEEAPLQVLRQIFLPELYEELCRLAAADPASQTGYFPPYHKR